MPEPNATVNPFDSAGVRLPTQGKGYSGTDSATDVAIVAALASPVPSENAPGTGVISVDIPFAAPGEVIEVEWSMGVLPDNTNLTPLTAVGAFVLVIDSALVPFSAFLQSGLDVSEPLSLPLTSIASLKSKTSFEVPEGMVYPLTVALVYAADGDGLIGNNQALGLAPPPCNFSVQRVPRERVLQMPPQNLI